MQNGHTIDIDRPASHVWAILSDGFASVGDWATSVPASRPAETGDGRICETPFRGFPEVSETMLAHDDDAMTYTYAASSVPRWLGRPKNTWFVEPLGDQRCRVGFRPEIDASALGKVAFRLSGFKLEDLASQVLEDLKHYAESGEPSPSKRAALD